MKKILTALLACLVARAALAQPTPVIIATNNAPAGTNGVIVAGKVASHFENVRTACIASRRHVCGRVLQVNTNGLVVDSGYTVLLQPPFNHSWVTRANVNVSRQPVMVEGNAPDAVAVGLVVITDLPKRPAVHRYDYVSLIGYPAGHCDYTPVQGVTKNLRRFSAGLEHAVNLTIQEEKH